MANRVQQKSSEEIPPKTRLELLRQELALSQAKFEKDSDRHKRMFRGLRFATFVVTALGTCLAALAAACPQTQPWMNLAVVLLTAAVTVITSYEILRKPSELWIHERTTLYALRDIKRELEFRILDDEDVDQAIAECFERLQNVLRASGDNWIRRVAPHQGKNDDKDHPPAPPRT